MLRFLILLLSYIPVFHSFSTRTTFLYHCDFALTSLWKKSSLLTPLSKVPSHHGRISWSLHASSKEKNWLMDEFRTADGEIINPYHTLKVDRDASKTEIRASYLKLSRKYHPDAARFRSIMPGKCDSLEQVRDEWDRISLSYNILSDKKMRLKYDRQSALNDPGKAAGRAAIDTIGWGVTLLAKGVFRVGKHVFTAATKSPNSSKPVIETSKTEHSGHQT